jgi:hypothetical protein
MAARRPPGPVRENSLSSFKELQMSTAKQALDKALGELAKTANNPKVCLCAELYSHRKSISVQCHSVHDIDSVGVS